MREVDPAHPGIDQLHHDHLLLREDIDTLAAAAAAHSTRDPDRLAALARGLIISLEQHLRSEAAALAELGDRYQAGATGWAARQHWYPLTEGPVINLDWLGADQVDDAVLNRLTHLRAGEQVSRSSLSATATRNASGAGCNAAHPAATAGRNAKATRTAGGRPLSAARPSRSTEVPPLPHRQDQGRHYPGPDADRCCGVQSCPASKAER